MTRDVTIKDIARALQVSAATVARALGDHPQISEATKVRVRTTAESLGYVAHSAARATRNGSSKLIGLVIPDVQNEFYGTLAKALAQSCDSAGFQLLLSITEDDPDSEKRQIRGLCEARVAGIVLVPTPHPQRETLALLRRSPCVQLIRKAEAIHAPWFGIDDRTALEKATSHLLSLGHERIAYIGGATELSTGRDRLRGFEDAFRLAGGAIPSDLIRLGEPRMDFAAEAFEELWSNPSRPTALVTGGARLCTGALNMALRLGLVFPGDISIVGYGDPPYGQVNLSTVSLPTREIAQISGEFLFRKIRERRPGDVADTSPVHETALRPELVLRGSTAEHVARVERSRTSRSGGKRPKRSS